jgi:urease gamma subunit
LNLPESIALITMQMMDLIRNGSVIVANLMSLGQGLMGTNQVLPGVAKIFKDIQVEATFPNKIKLLKVHSPIAAGIWCCGSQACLDPSLK